MLVSVITICFNSENCIAKTIESVLNQTYPEVEYIIIDGASSDATVSIAESYMPQFEQKGYAYKIISEPDQGIYDAMNKGIKNATGSLIGIINSGDWYENTAVSTAVENLPFDLFFADVNLIKPSGTVITKHSRMDAFPSSRHWNHPTMFVKKETYDALGLYKCRGIHDDFEFYLRARKAGVKIKIENTVLANFQTGGASNDKSFKKCMRRIKDRYEAYRVNGFGLLSILECVGIEAAKFILS